MYNSFSSYSSASQGNASSFLNQNTAQNSTQSPDTSFGGTQGALGDVLGTFKYYGQSLKSPIKSARDGKYNSIGGLFGGYGNIAGYNQDITSIEDIYKGKANSEDWGGVIGTAAGIVASVFAGGGDQGAFMNTGRAGGRKLFPAIRNLF